MNNSPFLFDDREYFIYGDTSYHAVAEYVELVDKIKKTRQATINYVKNGVVATTLLLTIPFSGQANLPQKLTSASAHGATMQTYSLKEISKSLRQARDFLGLTQKETSELLGLGKSTLEKIEQQTYGLNPNSTFEKIEAFNEWVNLLKESYGNRKFVVRPIVRAQSSLLGNISPLEYATENSDNGIFELLSLERKMNG